MSCQIMINNNNKNSNNSNKNKNGYEEEEDNNTITSKSIKKEESLNFIINSLFYKNSTKNMNNKNNRIKINDKRYDDENLNRPIYHLLDLPDDILLMIFRNLDVPSLLTVSELCNFFNSVSSNHDLWKELFFRKWGPLFPLVPVCTISCCHQYFSNPYCYLEPINQLFSLPFYKSLSIPKQALSAFLTSTPNSYTFKQLFKFRSLLFNHYKPIVINGLELLKSTISIPDIWMKINDPILSSSINSVTQSKVEKSIINKQPTTYININNQEIINQEQTTFCVKVTKIFPTRILKQILNLITDYEKIPLWDVSLRHCTGLIVKSPNYNNSKSIASNNSELDPIKKVDILHKQIIGNLYMTYVRMIYSQNDDSLKFFNDTLSGLNNIEDINNTQQQQQPTTAQPQQTEPQQNNKRKRDDEEVEVRQTTEYNNSNNNSSNNNNNNNNNNDSSSSNNNNNNNEPMGKQKVFKISQEFRKKAEENENIIRQQIMNDLSKRKPIPQAITNAILDTLASQSYPPMISTSSTPSTPSTKSSKPSFSSAAAACAKHVTSVLDQFDDIRLNHPIYVVQNAVPFKIAGDEHVNKYETFKLDCFGSGFIFEPLNAGKETKMTYLLQMGKQDWMEDVGELIDEMAISRNRSLNSLISHSYQLSRKLATPINNNNNNSTNTNTPNSKTN